MGEIRVLRAERGEASVVEEHPSEDERCHVDLHVMSGVALYSLTGCDTAHHGLKASKSSGRELVARHVEIEKLHEGTGVHAFGWHGDWGR